MEPPLEQAPNPEKVGIAPKQESLVLPAPDMIMATSTLSMRVNNAEKPPM